MFLMRTVCLMIAGLLSACATGAAAPPPPVALFDTHAHLMVENLTPEQEIALLKQVGLSRILLMHPEPEVLAALAEIYPGFVIPAFSTARPNAKGVHFDANTGAVMAKAYADHQVCAFGEISSATGADNDSFRSLGAAASSTGAPLERGSFARSTTVTAYPPRANQ